MAKQVELTENLAKNITEVQPAKAPWITTGEIVGDIIRGLWTDIPVFRLVLGLCPTLAVTTSAINGIGMGLATAFVLTASNILVSMLRKFIPDKVRIPSFIVIIATFVTITDLVMAAYVPDLHRALGIFIPLIVVNCIILGRAEAFASKNNVVRSAIDGLSMGVGFTIALLLLGTVREILGAGSWMSAPFLRNIFAGIGFEYQPIIVMILPPGAFIGLGFLVAGMNRLEEKFKKNNK